MPPNTIKVCRPGKWGNPFRIGGYFRIGDDRPNASIRFSWMEALCGPESGYTLIENAAMAVDFYRRLQANGYDKDFSLLHGKNLACWCPLDQPCHADVLLDLANR